MPSSAAAATSQFTRDTTNLTVAYSGSSTDYTFRRMILHYANLCVRRRRRRSLSARARSFAASRSIRGPAWTQGGHDRRRRQGHLGLSLRRRAHPALRRCAHRSSTVRGSPRTRQACTTSSPIRPIGRIGWAFSIRARTASGRISTSSMATAISISSRFDNYLPLSDWTTGDGGLDVHYWRDPAPNRRVAAVAVRHNGLGLSGQPTIYSDPVSEGEHRRRREIQLVL